MGEQTKAFLADSSRAYELIDQQISIKLANASWGAQTQANFNAVDKFVAWCQDKPLKGAFFNPAVLGAATALAYSGFTLATRSGLSRGLNLVAPGLGSLIGGTFAGMRRWHDLQHDIATHRAESAYGFQTPSGARRREAIEKLNYNLASIGELFTGGGTELTTGETRKGIDQLLRELSANSTDQAARDQIIQRITEINSRIDMSVDQKIDLITAQDSRNILSQLGGLTEQESLDVGRSQLILKVAEMRVALRRVGMSSAEIDNLENTVSQNWRQQLTQNKEKQDRITRNYKLKESFKAGTFGAAVGFSASLLTQEGIVLGERALGLSVGETNLEHIIGKLGDFNTTSPSILINDSSTGSAQNSTMWLLISIVPIHS